MHPIHTNDCRRYRSARTLHSAEQTSCFQCSLKACTSNLKATISVYAVFSVPFFNTWPRLGFLMSTRFSSKLLSIGARLCRCRLRSDSNCCAWRSNTSNAMSQDIGVTLHMPAEIFLRDSYRNVICLFFISRNVLSMSLWWYIYIYRYLNITYYIYITCVVHAFSNI